MSSASTFPLGTCRAMRKLKYPDPAPMSATTSSPLRPIASTTFPGCSSRSRSGRSSHPAASCPITLAISRPRYTFPMPSLLGGQAVYTGSVAGRVCPGETEP